MKKLIAWSNSRVKIMSIWDVKLLAAGYLFLGIFIALFFLPFFVRVQQYLVLNVCSYINIWMYFILFVLLIAKPVYVILFKKTSTTTTKKVAKK